MADNSRPFSPTPAPLLVGRESELAALRSAFAAAHDGHGSLILISGEAGVGKTALAEVLLAETTEQGAPALIGRCYDLSETPPYGPWIDLFARYRPGDDAIPPPPAFARRGTIGAVDSQVELAERLRDFLAALATTHPIALLLEDLHWADLASLDLLRLLARNLATLPLLLLATYRSDELTRRHPLYTLLPALVREGGALRLDLARFPEATVRALVTDRYGLPPTEAARLVAYLLSRAEGNALFTIELLRTLEEHGALAMTAEGWALGSLDRVPVPLLLAQVIAGRVARLGVEAERLLAVAAIIGQEVPLALWAMVAETDEEAILGLLERGATAGLLAEARDNSGARFAHALIREALYQSQLAARRRRMHRRVGEALAASANPDPDMVAYHFSQADDDRALDWLLIAADRAVDAAAFTAAHPRLESALRLLERMGAPAIERGWLLYRLGVGQVGVMASPTALQEAAYLAAEAGDRQLAGAVQGMQGVARCFAGALRHGLADLAAAADILTVPAAGSPAARLLGRSQDAAIFATGGYHGTLALWLANAGRYHEVTALVGRIVECARDGMIARLPLGAVSPAAHLALARSHAALGEPTAARQDVAQAHAHYRPQRYWAQIAAALIDELHLLWLPYATDLPNEGKALVAALHQVPLEPGFARVYRAAAHAPLLLLAGRWGETRTSAETARTLHTHGTSNPAGSLATVVLARLAAAQGNAVLLAMLLPEVLPDGSATAPGNCYFRTAVELQRSAATLALATGELPTARAWLEAHDRWLDWSGSVLGQAEGALGWAAYHRATGDTIQANQHIERALAHAMEPRQPLALLAAHRLHGELDLASGRPGDAQTHLDAALALADACAAPYERALTLLAMAELCAITNEHDRARVALEEARAILATLGATPTLVRADKLAARLLSGVGRAAAAISLPFGLSVRETEVLRLVAEGLTDAQIAHALFVSRHTVNAHTKAIYSKLGVITRAAAARLAVKHGLA